MPEMQREIPDDRRIIDLEVVRRAREKEQEIRALEQLLAQHEATLNELSEVLSVLFDRYGMSYSELGTRIEDRIIEEEVELESWEEELNPTLPTQVKIKKCKKAILEMKRDLEQWEEVYPAWEEMDREVSFERVGLYEGDPEAFMDFYAARGIGTDEWVKDRKEMQERSEARDADEEHFRWEQEEIARLREEEDKF